MCLIFHLRGMRKIDFLGKHAKILSWKLVYFIISTWMHSALICSKIQVSDVMVEYNNYSPTLSGVLDLTLWEPGYDIFVLWFWPKTSSCQLPYERPSSSTDCARELFKGSTGSASLVDCNRKKFFGWGVQIFCDWRHKWSSFRVILAHVAWPRAQPLGQNVSLKFSLETRLESESFEPF